MSCHVMSCGSFRKLGYLIWGPYNKDPTIKGTILGSPIFGNSHVRLSLKAARSPNSQDKVGLHLQVPQWFFKNT